MIKDINGGYQVWIFGFWLEFFLEYKPLHSITLHSNPGAAVSGAERLKTALWGISAISDLKVSQYFMLEKIVLWIRILVDLLENAISHEIKERWKQNEFGDKQLTLESFTNYVSLKVISVCRRFILKMNTELFSNKNKNQ